MQDKKSNVIVLPRKEASEKDIKVALEEGTRSKDKHNKEIKEAYDNYIAYGWKPIRIWSGRKRPIERAWIEKNKPEKDEFGGYDNIGIVLGEKSSGLGDVDIDHPDLVEAAPHFLPETGAKFGRYYGSEKQSLAHWLYRSTGDKTYAIKKPGEGVVIEIRSTGGQTVFPPSYVHDATIGMDLVCWQGGAKAPLPKLESIPEISYDALRMSVNLLAATVFSAKYFNAGSFHDDMLAWCGVLAKSGYELSEAKKSVTWLVEKTNQTGLDDRLAALEDTYSKYTNDEVVTGISSLKNSGWDEIHIAWLKNLLKVKSSFESDGRPFVRVVASKETELMEKTIAAMVETKKFYNMNGQIVIINRENSRNIGDNTIVANAKMIPLSTAISMSSWLTREIQFVQSALDKTAMEYKDQIIKAPAALSSELADVSTFRGDLPLLTGISNIPLITREARIIDEHWGYDEELATFFACKYSVKQYHPDESLYILGEPFVDFPFSLGGPRPCDIENDPYCSLLGFKYGRYYASAISAILSAIVRPALNICPLYVVTSSQWEDGKSVLSGLIAAAVGMEIGTANSPLTRGGSDEEQEKQISSVLARGKRVIIYDNHDGDFKSAALTETLTSSQPEFRILGKSEVKSIPNRSVILLNGVNIVLAGDLQTRSVMIRLARTDLSTHRIFKHHDIEGWCADNSDKLVSAGISLIAWAMAQPNGRWKQTHRFKDWDILVRRTILLACGVDISPPVSQDNDRSLDPMEEVKYDFLLWIRDLWDSGVRDSKSKKWLRARTIGEQVGIGSAQEGWINTLSKRPNQPIDVKCGRCLNAVKDFPFKAGNAILRIVSSTVDGCSVYKVETIEELNIQQTVESADKADTENTADN